jgi:tRNA G26 N,N-dimethylase Trm1
VTSQLLLAACRPLRLRSTLNRRSLQPASLISRKNSIMSDAGSSPITVPEGFTLHTENTSHILISSKEEAFLNPVQEFNRDLSVACIRVWSEELNREKEAKWKQTQERRAKREADADTKAGQRKDQKKAKSEHLVIQSLVSAELMVASGIW